MIPQHVSKVVVGRRDALSVGGALLPRQHSLIHSRFSSASQLPMRIEIRVDLEPSEFSLASELLRTLKYGMRFAAAYCSAMHQHPSSCLMLPQHHPRPCTRSTPTPHLPHFNHLCVHRSQLTQHVTVRQRSGGASVHTAASANGGAPPLVAPGMAPAFAPTVPVVVPTPVRAVEQQMSAVQLHGVDEQRACSELHAAASAALAKLLDDTQVEQVAAVLSALVSMSKIRKDILHEPLAAAVCAAAFNPALVIAQRSVVRAAAAAGCCCSYCCLLSLPKHSAIHPMTPTHPHTPCACECICTC